MTSDGEKCGLSSLLPMSCRGRTEEFARRLHSRLRSLGSQDETTNETSWLQSPDNSLALSQPKHSSSDNDVFFDFNTIESLESPGELESSDIDTLINEDPLTNRVNAAADEPFYDAKEHVVNGETLSIGHSTQNKYITPPTCTLSNESKNSLDSAEVSILSLNGKKEDDESSLLLLDCMGSINDISKDLKEGEEGTKENISEIYTSSLNINKDFTIICPSTENNKIELVLTTSNECIKLDPNKELFTANSLRRPEDDEDDELEERTPRVRRCSSLKTGKTPPGTPGRKKIVRFADVLGLDLADVRTFLDEIPKVPNSAYEDLKNVDLNDSDSSPESNTSISAKFHGIKPDRVLLPLFQQPGGQPDFLDKVRERQVCLENALVEDPVALSVTGTVRVRNLDFHKTVHVRYTLDSWQNFSDLQATYVQNSCDGFSDKFSFLLYGHSLTVGQRLEFAVRFQCKGCQYWDNNNGANYCFQCLPATNGTPYDVITGEDSWGASFYYQQEDVDEERENTTEEEFITHTDVQEYIKHTLQQRSHETPAKEKSNVTAIFIVLIFSVLFMYLQKAISFAK